MLIAALITAVIAVIILPVCCIIAVIVLPFRRVLAVVFVLLIKSVLVAFVFRIIVLLICLLKFGDSGERCIVRSAGGYRSIGKRTCGGRFRKEGICRCRCFGGSRCSDRYRIIQMTFQFGQKAILCFGYPVFMRGFQSQKNLSTFLQITHFHGSVCQLARSLFQLLSSKLVAVKKPQTIIIETICRNNIVKPVDGQFQIGIDLNSDSSIGGQTDMPGSQNSQEEACSKRSSGEKHSASAQGFDCDGVLFCSTFYNEGYRFPDLIIQIGNLQKSSCLIQNYSVSGMAFHYKISHSGFSFRFINCRCPRMISKPLV